MAHRVDHRVHARRPRVDYGVQEGKAVVAGQVDLVLRSTNPAMAGTEHEYWCIDYKTTNPAPKYHKGPPNLLGGRSDADYHHRAKPPFSELRPTTSVSHGAAQLLRVDRGAQYSVDFRSHMYLLQINDNEQSCQCPTFARCRAGTWRSHRSSRRRWRQRASTCPCTPWPTEARSARDREDGEKGATANPY